MKKELKIDRAIYLVDDEKRSYTFLRRNPDWRDLTPAVNEANKWRIDGYTRVFRSGNTRKFHNKSSRTQIGKMTRNLEHQDGVNIP
jgi:hypothetical protein